MTRISRKGSVAGADDLKRVGGGGRAVDIGNELRWLLRSYIMHLNLEFGCNCVLDAAFNCPWKMRDGSG